MSDERLRQLLQQADEAFGGPPAGPGDLGAKVRRRVQRERTLRVAGGAAVCTVVLVAGSIAWVGGWGGGRPTERLAPGPDAPQMASIAELQAKIEQLREEVRTGCEALAEVLRREESERQLAALQGRAEADPLEEVNEQVDRAALTMVYQADRMYRELNLRESAVASYEQTIKLFPQTHWAQVAKNRLAELKTAGKGDAI